MESSSGFEEKGQGFEGKINDFKTLAHASLETLADVAVQCNEPEVVSNPTNF
jgi:hypothetical protein